MVAVAKRWLIIGAVALALFAPVGCQQIQNVQHRRDEAAFLAGVKDFECGLLGCGMPRLGLDEAVAADVQARPEHYIAAGDKACDWLRGHRKILGTWGWLGGPSAASMRNRYQEELFGVNESGLEPEPTLTRAELREEQLYMTVTDEAWKHLCWDIVSSRTSWPEEPWAHYS